MMKWTGSNFQPFLLLIVKNDDTKIERIMESYSKIELEPSEQSYE
jgi:hypothetical protein